MIADLIGRTFGRLAVVDKGPNGKNNRDQWWCKCNCGNEELLLKRGNDLRTGRLKSCGCARKEKTIKRNKEGHKTNNYSEVLSDEYGEYYIGITSNTGSEFYVDASDFDLIKDYCWYEIVDNKGYHFLATTFPDDNKTIKIQWVIGGKNIDHADRNALNNRRYNLREANSSQQNMNQKIQSNNTTGFIGVYFRKTHGDWQAGIGVNNKQVHLGYFNQKEDAIKARLRAELKYFGKDFSPQRHLFEEYGIEDIIEEDENVIQKEALCG